MTRTDYALKYAALGLHVLPIWWMEGGRCACGSQACKSPGKHPIASLVPNGLQDATVDPARLRGWFDTHQKANMGVSLEPSYLCAMDVDPRNGGDATLDDLEAQHGPIASDWHQRTGGGGQHFIFAIGRGLSLPGTLGKGIDLKYRGYVLVEPSRTEDDYLMLDGGPLEGDMPSDAPAWLMAMTKATKPLELTEEPGSALGFDWMGEDGFAELKSALQAIPNFERSDWLKVGMAIHMLNPRQEGYQLWCWWSQIDRGADKFDEEDQARVWLSFTRKKDVSLHRESIFFWAYEQGWKSTEDKSVAAMVEKVVDTMTHGEPMKIADTRRQFDRRCPVAYIDEVAAWLSQHGGCFYRDASLVGAITLAVVSSSRTYVGTDGSPPHVYMGISARSLNEIRYISTGLENILVDSGIRRMLRSIRFGGPGALYKTIYRSPATLYMTTEWETLLRFARRQPSGTTEQVLNLIADLHGRRDVQVDSADEFGFSKITGGEEQPVIRNPAFSMLALLSTDAWELLGKSSEIGRGATELMFTVSCDPDQLQEISQRPEEVPTWLIDHVRKVRKLPPIGQTELDTDLETIFQTSSGLRPNLIPVSFDVPPERYDHQLAQITTRRALRPLIQGARVTMRRLAVALAAWNDPDRPAVTRPIMEWCAAFVAHHMREMADRIDVMDNEGAVTVAQKVLTKIMDAGPDGMTERELVKACRPFKNMEKEAQAKLLDQMAIDGDVHMGDPSGKRRGKRIVAAKFVQPNALVSAVSEAEA